MECCASADTVDACRSGCPYYDAEICVLEVMRDALSLIKELTEENDRLSTALANYDRITEERIAEEYYTAEAYEELREENERLKASLAKYDTKTIVHCEDCHYGARDVRGHIYCFKHAGCILRNNDDFCSCGKIK